MTINPMFVSKPRSSEDRTGSSQTEKEAVAVAGHHGEAPRGDEVNLSLEARALSGDSSLDNATLERFQRIAHKSIQQQRKSDEQARLVRSLLGLDS